MGTMGITELLDVLASSVMEHLPSDGKIAGTISKLYFDSKVSRFGIEKLPQCLCHSITSLTLSVHPTIILSSLNAGIADLR